MIKRLVSVIAFLTAINTIYACSMFTATKDGKTLTGNNEDYYNSNTQMWTVNGKDGEFSRIYFGFSDMDPQGGMNEKGLVFDGFATPFKKINNEGKIQYNGYLVDLIMSKCITIKDVISIFDKYESHLEEAQLMFVDRSGNSVIIEGDDYVFKKGNHQITTNFYCSEINNKSEIDCDRYNIADKMLDTSAVTVDNFRKILAAVHNEWDGGSTLYSNIYDADKLVIYLYLHHNYENVVVIDFNKELEDEDKIVELYSMFPPSFCAMNIHQQGNSDLTFEEDMNKTWKEDGVSSLLNNFQIKYDGYKKLQPLLKKYDQIDEEYGVTIDTEIDHWVLNTIGYELMKEKKYSDAILVLEYNAKLFPDEPNVYDSLGDVYLKNGDKKNAIKYYKKNVALNPKNLKAVEIIKQLQSKK